MEFFEQAKKGQGNFGTYLLTVASVIFALLLGNTLAEMLAQQVLGFSLLNVPGFADHNTVLALRLLPFTFVFISILLSIKYLHKRPILSVFTRRNQFDWKRFFTAFGLWGGVMAISLVIGIFTTDNIEWNFKAESFFSLLAISIFLMPIQTSAEELLFRGYLFQGFGSVFKRGVPVVIITGVLFGLLHGANPEVAKLGKIVLLYYIGTGIFLGLLTHMDDGMELSLGYHAVNNIFAALLVTNDWQAFQTDALFIDRSAPSFGWEMILTLVVLQPLLLFFFSKRYNWKSWKEKLLK